MMTGPAAWMGELQKNVADIAIAEINENGGINGRPLELKIEDTQYVSTAAVNAYQALKARGVDYYIAEASHVAAPLREKFVADGNFNIIAGAVTSAYTDDSNLTCRIALTVETFGPQIAEAFVERGEKHVAFLVSDNEYGRGMAEEITKSLDALGGEVVHTELFTAGEGDTRTQLTKLVGLQDSIDALFIINTGNTIEPMLSQLRELGWAKIVMGDVWTLRNPNLKDLTLAEGHIVADYEYDPARDQFGDVEENFKKRYQELFGNDPVPYLAVATYDEISILTEALRETNVGTPNEVGEYVRSIKGYKGASGTITFGDGCEVERPVVFREFVAGSIQDL